MATQSHCSRVGLYICCPWGVRGMGLRGGQGRKGRGVELLPYCAAPGLHCTGIGERGRRGVRGLG